MSEGSNEPFVWPPERPPWTQGPLGGCMALFLGLIGVLLLLPGLCVLLVGFSHVLPGSFVLALLSALGGIALIVYVRKRFN